MLVENVKSDFSSVNSYLNARGTVRHFSFRNGQLKATFVGQEKNVYVMFTLKKNAKFVKLYSILSKCGKIVHMFTRGKDVYVRYEKIQDNIKVYNSVKQLCPTLYV